ncbi:lipid IV(A) 3-deoxy-D-manno-octulosonic acid transferase [Aurantivibrio plasticivorans]
MNRQFYTALFYACLPLIALRLLWRALRAPAYLKRWGERFGYAEIPPLKRPPIWLHSVSVGESLAAVPLVKSLLSDGEVVVMTTMTPTGSVQVQNNFAEAIAAKQLIHVYAPYDLPASVQRFLSSVGPKCLIIMETELWPNTIAACTERNIPVVLANGRLSEKSARGYQKIGGVIGGTFKQLTKAAVQHRDDGRRMMALGLPQENCVITGSIKFDLTISDDTRQSAAALRNEILQQPRHIWLAASTHLGEDEKVLAAFKLAKQLNPKLFLILVPRHPERFNNVANQCEAGGWKVQRRSRAEAIDADCDILLGDTMGELLMLYGVADCTFVGGSLVPVGGHNLIEPAAWGSAIMSGPHLFNFAEVSRLLKESDAMAITDDVEQLSATVANLTSNDELRSEMGKRAKQIADANRGALDKLLAVIKPYR